ncbi:efflux RND transporter periplasmic adaptor subunit [Opitutaceae bacterium EW11]|nr:efflux RND transporter periplasmic adaptor subunit [Opitutaceae bacterium EW11]
MKAPVQPAPADLAAIIHAGGPKKKLKRRLIVAVGVCLVVAASCVALRPRASADNAAPFVTEPLRRGDLSLTITATGNLEPTNQVTVGSELSGLVQTVYVDINDRVTKGQPLAQLDTTKLNQQIESSRAALDVAKAKVAQAEAALKAKEAALVRVQELRRVSNGRYPSQADVDTAVAEADGARADLQSAQASVTGAVAQVHIDENNLAKAVITSPVDGIVLTRSVDPGQTVAASLNAPELFVIAEKLERMKLKITVAEADIARMVAGLKASFTVDAWPDRVYTATVQRVSYGSSVTNNVVTYETDLEVANDDLSLRPGMTATADIRVAERKDVFLVPSSALRLNLAASPNGATAEAPKKSFLQRVMPMPPPRGKLPVPTSAEKTGPGTGRLWILQEGRPEPMLVRTGLSDGRNTEISGDGIDAGMPVILRTALLNP